MPGNSLNTFKHLVDSIIDARHLLQHPFYLAWTEGRLTRTHLRRYAEQYFYHVLAEPTYLSAVHFNTPNIDGDITVRQLILGNLIDEEAGPDNHPALWKSFAQALGADDASLASTAPLATTAALVATFRALCIGLPFYAGLAALHAFESQVPAIAAAKIDGLTRFHGFEESKDYAFFSVHQEADVHHARTEWALIERFADTPDKQECVMDTTRQACDALWHFLDGVWLHYCGDLDTEVGKSSPRISMH